MLDSELLVSFLNTVDVEARSDVLDDEATWRAWVDRAGLTVPGHRDDARRLRSVLRSLATGEDTDRFTVPATVVIGPDGPALASDTALGAIAGACVRLAVQGDWPRVKICPADDCRWAFYDRSRNGSRQWCSMEGCGNRAKARAHRARRSG